MSKVILIYANCLNPTAKGDFALAGNMARDITYELVYHELDVKVVLTSTLEGMWKYHSLYGQLEDNKVTIDDTQVELCPLELFDNVANKVVAFVEANRCKYAPAELLKRVLSPESKILFVGAANCPMLPKQTFLEFVRAEQPGIYSFFDEGNIRVLNTGLGAGRIGLPRLKKTENLPILSQQQRSKLPNEPYGFMYFAVALSGFDAYINAAIIGQYVQLTQYKRYVLVGAFENDASFRHQFDLSSAITFHQSLDALSMRHMVANSQSLVGSTGVMSTLEVMHDGKLPFYQKLDINEAFVVSYLLVVKSICQSDTALIGQMNFIIQLSELLFAPKPLDEASKRQLQGLLAIERVKTGLVEINHRIVEQANGKLAPKLLSFLGHSSATHSGRAQCVKVCLALQKSGETSIPLFDQALRRAAAWGK